MTVSGSLPKRTKVGSEALKLRINLNVAGTKRPERTSRKSSPSKVSTATGARLESNGVFQENSRNLEGYEQKAPAGNGENESPFKNAQVSSAGVAAPLKLKFSLKPAEERGPRIVLSLRKPDSSKAEPSVDIETVDRLEPGGFHAPSAKLKRVDPEVNVVERKPLKKRLKEGRDTNTKKEAPKREREDTLSMSNLSIEAYNTIAAVKPLSSAKLPLTSTVSPGGTNGSAPFRPSMTRVPIAALSSFTTMTPLEREEERIWRQSLVDTLGSLWQAVAKPDVGRRTGTVSEIIEATIPYWMMLSPVDSALNAPSLRTPMTGVGEADNREKRITEEYERLKGRLAAFALADRNRGISSELLVLEQKLCLEEEKFLFAKLKSEYNAKVVEIMAKRRQLEVAIPTQNPVSGAVALASTTVAHHKILPRLVPEVRLARPTASGNNHNTEAT